MRRTRCGWTTRWARCSALCAACTLRACHPTLDHAASTIAFAQATARSISRPCSGDEQNTLFIALADHQRVGKGTLYHGLRTPMVLQFPSRVPPGQTLPASTLVHKFDLRPTATVTGSQYCTYCIGPVDLR